MGLREAVWLGLVLLSSCGNLCVASHKWPNISTNETLSQVPQEEVTAAAASSPLPRATDRRANRTEGQPARSPVTYRLKTYQLRSPAVGQKQKTIPNPQEMQAGRLTSEQLELGGTVHTQEPWKPAARGPDLNPAVRQQPKVKVEQRVPVPAHSVAVRCGEREVTVEVRKNFLGNGQLIRPSDLTLGGCAASAAAAATAATAATAHVLLFQTELQSCGSTVKMTGGALVYSFSLVYSPTPIGNTFIVKTNPAEVAIECHYQRRHFVSSGALRPTWKPFASDMLAEQGLHFSLRLMTEDWQAQRPSGVYFLSDVMHIEAAVLQGHHVPLRVYVDSCVATAGPDPGSQPAFTFINNHGCLTDAKLTGAKSYFMQRSREDKLHFLLKAFRFRQDHRNSLYIRCHLKATTISVPIDSQHKACSFLTEANRWVASDGDNKVCGCCESSCGEQRQRRSLAADADLDGPPPDQWEGWAALGPILLEEIILQEELTAASELPPEPLPLPEKREVAWAASSPSIALMFGVGAALAVVLLVFMGAVTGSRLRKPTGQARTIIIIIVFVIIIIIILDMVVLPQMSNGYGGMDPG
ncbi:zona pellucida sperm-binding protein 3-like [Scophthalmus maximus]|uniref:zona pellucida sperm-binding protein 3-like n=1 Tax=Scophthalmus maximus TaxID=52904 RepID=UPI001FA875DB|nr:zona pellucida sperm-binding protein 3-like [Scophthalmus maximus]